MAARGEGGETQVGLTVVAWYQTKLEKDPTGSCR